MQNRIDQCFERLRARNAKGFIAYICTGDPKTVSGGFLERIAGFVKPLTAATKRV